MKNDLATALAVAISIAKPFEGLRLKKYLCPAGFPTIGYGHRCSDSQVPITIGQAEDLLRLDMSKALCDTMRLCPRLVLYPKELGAIADFTYNLGAGRLQASTLRRRIGQGNWALARTELLKWVRGGGRVLPGLVARRRVEGNYFNPMLK